jgi:O-antigen/teichoic acid export membrane protein
VKVLDSVLDRLPRGTVPVGGGLVVLGVSAYGYLTLTAHALGPVRYGALSARWGTSLVLGQGFFYPIEQQLARDVAHRIRRGDGPGPVIHAIARLGLVLLAVLAVVVAGTGALLLHRLFDGDVVVLVSLVLAIVGSAVEYAALGTLLGDERFGRYGAVLSVEGATRLVACATLAALHVHSPGAYGLLIGGASLAGAAVGLPAVSIGRRAGSPVVPRQVRAALLALVGAALSAQVLANVGSPLVKALASPREQTAAGRFLASLVLARIPLFLFAAVQAAALARFAGLAAAEEWATLKRAVRDLAGLVVALAAVATVVSAANGPAAVRLLFGPSLTIGRATIAVLTAGSGFYMLALVAAAALVGVGADASTAIGWTVGVVTLALLTALPGSAMDRVAMALRGGGAAPAAALLGLLRRRLRQHTGMHPHPLSAGLLVPPLVEP